MKTRLFLAALAGVALASCVTDKEYDVPAQNENIKIAFDSPVMYDNDTRANYHGEIGSHQYAEGGITYSYPRAEDFQIYAIEHSDNFEGWGASGNTAAGFNNSSVSYDSSLDGWAPKNNGSYYHWPSGKNMSFAACSPAGLEQTSGWDGRRYGATGLTLEDFKVPANAEKHFDLMFSTRVVNQTSANMVHGADYYSGIPLQFQHALSSIHFSLMNSSSEKVVLTKISLYGVHDTGTFNENITENTSNYAEYIRKTSSNASGNVDPKWTIDSGATKLSEGDAYVAFDGALEFPAQAQYISNMLTQSNNAENTSKNHVLLLMPQTLNEDAKLRVDYTVNNSPAYKIVELKDAIENKTGGSAITEWVMGTRYTYRLHYSAASASQDKIYFSPKSDEWKDAGVAVIELKN